MIVVLDYGLGNIRSILNMFHRIAVKATASSSPDDLLAASGLVLPGVGAFDAGVRMLTDSGLREPLEQAVTKSGVPLLGICLGMQLLAEGSEEGSSQGLGWVDARCRRFDAAAGRPVPHMGWNDVTAVRDNRILAMGLDEQRFYFLHSYHLVCENPEDVLAVTQYGESFPSIVGRGNIFGVQFHPEKSHRFGMRLLERFSTIVAGQ
jgi:glutamine amidotransferase